MTSDKRIKARRIGTQVSVHLLAGDIKGARQVVRRAKGKMTTGADAMVEAMIADEIKRRKEVK